MPRKESMAWSKSNALRRSRIAEECRLVEAYGPKSSLRDAGPDNEPLTQAEWREISKKLDAYLESRNAGSSKFGDGRHISRRFAPF